MFIHNVNPADEIVNAERLAPSLAKGITPTPQNKRTTAYSTTSWTFPLTWEGIVYTGYLPGFEEMYAGNDNGDVLRLARYTISHYEKEKLPRVAYMATKAMSYHNETITLHKSGIAHKMRKNGIMFLMGVRNDPVVSFPFEYLGKTWVRWLPELGDEIAMVATDGSVYTLEGLTLQSRLNEMHYVYKAGHMADVEKSIYYKNTALTCKRILLRSLARVKK